MWFVFPSIIWDPSVDPLKTIVMARYGRGHDVEREDSAISIESDGDSFLASPPGEESPLLPTDLPADIVPPKSFQRLVIGLVVLFLILIEIGEYLSDPPEMSIIEGILCRERYPDHQLLSASDSDPRCKDTEIQKEIAMIRSWAMSLESLIRKLNFLTDNGSSS